MTGRWQFWIDVGGTFTDCIAYSASGVTRTHKLLSSGVIKGTVGSGSTALTIRDGLRSVDPENFFENWEISVLAPEFSTLTRRVRQSDKNGLYLESPLPAVPEQGCYYELRCAEEAPVIGIRWLLKKKLSDPIGEVDVKLGTTRGTNALLERQGARVTLVTTKGFEDVLRIAYQNRPSLFSLDIRKPHELYESVIEVSERTAANGTILDPIDRESVRQSLVDVHATGIRSIAVCLLNSYRNRQHEDTIAEIAKEIGFDQISLSSRLSPLQKMVSRGDTTVVDAYLTPIIRDYVAGIARSIPEGSLKLMTSAGSLVDAHTFVGKDSILSGPAGGVVGFAHVAQQSGYGNAIGFDMGGTSTDVSRFDGRYERRFEMEVNDPESATGVRVVAPMMSIETVAAGGGSICWFDGQKPVVGPRSAGADPGPACYGRGGPLTVTDVNLFLGYIPANCFPFPLDMNAVTDRLSQLCKDISQSTNQSYSLNELAVGFRRIANANMIAPIKKISIARGYDIRDYCLVSFGGAGAQHACAIAQDLGITEIVLSRFGGVLSAFGIGMADVSRFANRDVGQRFDSVMTDRARENDGSIEPLFHDMETQLHEEIYLEGIGPEQILPAKRFLDIRYAGQDNCITVPRPEDGLYEREFEIMHKQLYGFIFQDRPLEIFAARMELTGVTTKATAKVYRLNSEQPTASQTATVNFGSGRQEVPVYLRDELLPGNSITGPAIVIEPICTIAVEPGWHAKVDEHDALVLTHVKPTQAYDGVSTNVDAITLELFNNQFASIAEQMGTTLQKTSLSTNVKERLDFSCAIFSTNGDLVVNAPHIPVHLGAMSECVKCLLQDVQTMEAGEVYVTNDPFRGGSHLPDVTVVTPVFVESLNTPDIEDMIPRRPLFFVASRAHHSEIGGITPGSMPPFSRSLAQEGILIQHYRLVTNDASSEQGLIDLLSSPPYPSRSVHENIADINAQVAANQAGVKQLLQMVNRYGHQPVHAYMGHIQKAAETKTRMALRQIPEGEHQFDDTLEDGSQIHVTIAVSHGENLDETEAIIDFAGTSDVSPGNLNANKAITSSAVIYCFRCLIDEPIPLNAGLLAPLKIVLPDNCVLNPLPGDSPETTPAVVGGNVETSQRIVDVLFGAMALVSASQGTMNNFLFGRASTADQQGFGYYETICGGAGAGPSFDGADAVHTHMTNTRLTDPEVLEDRYPVRLRRFAIRRDSGGAGMHRGGNGIVREVEFIEPLSVSLLTSRRASAPFGMEGGKPGRKGCNTLIHADGSVDQLPGAIQLEVQPNDVLRIETPGGGGWGCEK